MAGANRSFVCRLLWVTASAALFYVGPTARAGTDLGIFEAETDVGVVAPPGSAQFDKAAQQYTLKSSGQNIWAKHDDFHFVYRKISGDFVATAEVSFVGPDTHPHRKAGWMVRQGLEPDAPYVDVMVHGEGLIALQYRLKQGDVTETVKSPVSQPAIVRFERHGDTFELYVAPKPNGKDQSPKFQSAGSVKLALADPAYIGLAVSAHDPTAVETAVVSGVSLKTGAAGAAAPKP